MGVNYGQRRQRSSDLKNPGELVSYSIGTKDINMEHYDEQVVYDHINARIDAQEAKLKKKSEEFER